VNKLLLYSVVTIGGALLEPAVLLGQRNEMPDSTPPATTVAASASATPSKTFFTRNDLKFAALAVFGTALVSSFDKRIAHYTQTAGVQGSTSRHTVANDLTKVNETTLTAGAIVTYGAGRLTHSSTVADVGLHTAEALILTSAISQAIRGPLGRARPSASDNPYHFQAGKGFLHFNNRSFPSLHSATAYAAASAISGEIHARNPDANAFISPVLYTAAAVPGLIRMYLNQHWASDVVGGAFVGTLIGSRVVSYAHSHRRTKLDRFLLGTNVASNGYGGTTVSVSLDY
jgi:membrane-associated phospholipid phosphatase